MTRPLGDPRWVAWTAPLLEFLAVPRGWPELLLWAEEQSSRAEPVGPMKVRQMVAYLWVRGLAAYHVPSETWRRVDELGFR